MEVAGALQCLLSAHECDVCLTLPLTYLCQQLRLEVAAVPLIEAALLGRGGHPGLLVPVDVEAAFRTSVHGRNGANPIWRIGIPDWSACRALTAYITACTGNCTPLHIKEHATIWSCRINIVFVEIASESLAMQECAF